jgi:hypothetical protein
LKYTIIIPFKLLLIMVGQWKIKMLKPCPCHDISDLVRHDGESSREKRRVILKLTSCILKVTVSFISLTC